jgi:hypothetical protein
MMPRAWRSSFTAVVVPPDRAKRRQRVLRQQRRHAGGKAGERHTVRFVRQRRQDRRRHLIVFGTIDARRGLAVGVDQLDSGITSHHILLLQNAIPALPCHRDDHKTRSCSTTGQRQAIKHDQDVEHEH